MSSPTEIQPTPPGEPPAAGGAPSRAGGAQTPPRDSRAAKRLASYSVKNMIYSMVAVVALALAWWALMPHPDSLERRPVEVSPVATYAASQSQFPVWTPESILGEDWTANFASYERFAGGAVTWRVGLVTPGEEYVEISQAADVTDEWLGALTERAGEEVGTRTITGPDGPQEWTAHEGQERAVVLGPGDGREATTVVRGTATWEEIEEFIGLLEVADAG